MTTGKTNESESCSVTSNSLWPHGLYSPWDSPGQNTGVGSCSLLQGIFLTQGSNPGLLHYRHILYQLSHQGSPRILEWVAYPFSSGSSHQESAWSLLHCRWILYQLSYQGSHSLDYMDVYHQSNVSAFQHKSAILQYKIKSFFFFR